MLDTIKITTEKIRNVWLILVDGKGYTLQELADFCGINRDVVGVNLSRKSPEKFQEWVNKKVILNKHGLPGGTKLVFRGDSYCWSQAIVKEIGCHVSMASRQLIRWGNKEIDCDELFRPPGPINGQKRKFKANTKNKGDWSSLKGTMQPRQNIKNITSNWNR